MDKNLEWLNARLNTIWGQYFSDIPQETPVRIKWGQRSYRRLGSIRLKTAPTGQHYSQITISSLLKAPQVTSLIVDQIIAHEIVHYVHGFGSERPRILRHPHQGGVIMKEFQKRGLWEIFRYYDSWMKLNWVKFVQSQDVL